MKFLKFFMYLAVVFLFLNTTAFAVIPGKVVKDGVVKLGKEAIDEAWDYLNDPENQDPHRKKKKKDGDDNQLDLPFDDGDDGDDSDCDGTIKYYWQDRPSGVSDNPHKPASSHLAYAKSFESQIYAYHSRTGYLAPNPNIRTAGEVYVYGDNKKSQVVEFDVPDYMASGYKAVKKEKATVISYCDKTEKKKKDDDDSSDDGDDTDKDKKKKDDDDSSDDDSDKDKKKKDDDDSSDDGDDTDKDKKKKDDDSDDGKDGKDGDKGKKGDDGDDGKDGKKGDKGKEGDDGDDGKDGKDGKDGQGKDGKDGKDGGGGDDDPWCKDTDLTQEACEFFDWVDDDPKEKEDKKIDVEDEEEKPLDDDVIDVNGNCPPNQEINIKMPWGYATTVEFDYKPYCDFAVQINPYVTAMGFLLSFYIVTGVRKF